MDNVDDLIGQELGEFYRLKERIATGGQASVYRATRVDDTGSQYAVKVASAKPLNTDGMLQRFEREIAIGRRLGDNRYIVRHHCVGDSPRPFIVMDYCAEGTLQDQFRETFPSGWSAGQPGVPVPLEAFLPYICQVAEALDGAHQKGIIHRDVKPTNILIDRDDYGLYARLSDFGIALLPNANDDQLTLTGQGMGTPQYMAPEQITDAHHVGPAADQYALAVVVYQLLTGVLPSRMNSNAAPLAFLGDKVVAVLLKALAKDPLDRYPSVLDFVQELERAYGEIHSTPTEVDNQQWPLPRDVEELDIAWWQELRKHWVKVKAKGFGPLDRMVTGFIAAPILYLISLPFTYGLTFPFGHYWLSIVVAIAALFGVPHWLKWRF